MKLQLRQLVAYDIRSMVYRLGQRNKRYRLRNIRTRSWLLGIVGTVGITIAAGMATGIGPRSITQALADATSNKPTATTKGVTVTQANNRKGSSKPPPSGEATTASAQVAAATANAVQPVSCALFPPGHAGLSASAIPELRKLSQYEEACSGAVAARSSTFVPTPTTVAEAQSSAAEVASVLKAFAACGVTPLVFIEPDGLNGDNLDLSQYANGAYDAALDAYFAALKADGVTDSTMGMWVLVPEGNLPVWSTVDPNVYTAVVTKTAQVQKKYFPGSQTSLMLDSESYPVGGTWGDGKYVSLAPYVQNIPKGLIDSFGLQGFPWGAAANQAPSTSYDPHGYLRTDFAIQAAQILGVQSIWFNTGTFGRMYTNQANATISLTPTQRQAMLSAVVQQAAQVKAQGFSVAIHLFAQDKSKLAEATDWSYWHAQPGDDPATAAFTAFAHDSAVAGVQIWLYDVTN